MQNTIEQPGPLEVFNGRIQLPVITTAAIGDGVCLFVGELLACLGQNTIEKGVQG